MALLCLARAQGRCYRADRSWCWFLPWRSAVDRIGGIYANDASVLCGDRLCGGPLDFQAASIGGRRPSETLPVTGPSV